MSSLLLCSADGSATATQTIKEINEENEIFEDEGERELSQVAHSVDGSIIPPLVKLCGDGGTETASQDHRFQLTFTSGRRTFVHLRMLSPTIVTKESSEDAVDIRGTQNAFEPVLRRENTIAVQCVRPVMPLSVQTPFFRQIEAATQTEKPISDAGHIAWEDVRDPDTGLKIDHARLQAFFDYVMPRTLHHLTQNVELPIFQDDYARLVDEDSFSASREESNLIERGNYSHLFTRGRSVSSVDWRGSRLRDDTVVVAVNRLGTLEERFQKTNQCHRSVALVWELSDLMHPRFVLDSPAEISCIRFNPSAPNIIIGGSVTGQLFVWDTEAANHTLGEACGERDNKGRGKRGSEAAFPTGKPSPQEDEDVRTIPPMPSQLHGFVIERDGDSLFARIQPKMASRVESSHRRAVNDIQWLPGNLEFLLDGQLNNAPLQLNNQFFTVSDDGSAAVWDVRPEYLPEDRLRRLRHQGQLGGDSTLWAPLFKHALKCADGELVSALRIAVDGRDPDTGSVKYTFTVASEEGKLCYCAVPPKNDKQAYDSLESGTSKRLPVVRNTIKAHVGSACALQQHPQIPGIFLTCGDWSFKVWRAGVCSPIAVSPQISSLAMCACWAPTRSSIIVVGTGDGRVQVWDLLDRLTEPVVSIQPAQDAITCMQFKPVPERRSGKMLLQLLLGTHSGTFHWYTLPRVFTRGPTNERALIEQLFAREIVRAEFMEWRWIERGREADRHGIVGITPSADSDKEKHGSAKQEQLADSIDGSSEIGEADFGVKPEEEEEFQRKVELIAQQLRRDEVDGTADEELNTTE